ncbi:hypothetical protein [Legionella feeleii]|uniref:Uncharacterized protein n=1 Tax=Legionella feeleii TaxID=453 RepID=A0A0W0TH82_9GAMM|nr:hypothetical protein [Legionella feeleii]KTC94922.1 hypothetical protein Lfee_2586 [Legionella feeleii]SPX62015.1 Uncharacterised protein [Legionella feeleii]
MDNKDTLIIKDLSEKTAIHPRLLSAVPLDMLELINKLDAEHDRERIEEESKS